MKTTLVSLDLEPFARELLLILMQGYTIRDAAQILDTPVSSLDKVLAKLREQTGAKNTLHLVAMLALDLSEYHSSFDHESFVNRVAG